MLVHRSATPERASNGEHINPTADSKKYIVGMFTISPNKSFVCDLDEKICIIVLMLTVSVSWNQFGSFGKIYLMY